MKSTSALAYEVNCTNVNVKCYIIIYKKVLEQYILQTISYRSTGSVLDYRVYVTKVLVLVYYHIKRIISKNAEKKVQA